MIQLKDEIKEVLLKLFDEVWDERLFSSSAAPIVKSEKLNIDDKLVKVLISFVDDRNVIIKIKHQKAQG